ncbi:MAG: TonB-dependent receptor [Caulobacterales bacterium]|nr:TonB-dependent receptor [Caulobacterales bacterium]
MLNASALRRFVAGGIACACLLGEDAWAQDAVEAPAPAGAATGSGAGVTSYPPTFFAEFKPTSAFDMVQRLPGFSFNGGADVRGFGGAAGNVMIDGERPSSKAVSLQQLLQRIPVSQVERIDLVRDASAGLDMQGQPVVANVIRKSGASSTLALQMLAKAFDDGFVGVVPRVEATWRSGPLSLEGQLQYRNDRSPSSGDGPFWRRSASGASLFDGRFDVDSRQDLVNFNVGAEYRPGADVLRFNLSGAREVGDRRERSDLTDAVGAYQVFNDSEEIDNDWELGGDYERPLTSKLTGRLVGLATFSNEESTGVNRGRSGSQRNESSSEGGERIVRALLTATPFTGVRLEGGAEGAFNFLDSRTALTDNGVVVPLPSANVRVEERRGEAFITGSWQASSALSLDGTLRYERSTISQTGGANQERTLAFAKPRLIASWAPDKSSQVRFRLEREVGQLDFGDFAASAQLDTGVHNAGNPNLQPERAWVTEAAFERRFWSQGAVVLTLTRANVESVVDLIPIDNRYDAPGNIGDGWRNTAKLNLTLPFDNLGRPGMLLKLNGLWQKTEVTDPVTGRKRRITSDTPFDMDFILSQTLPSLDSLVALEVVKDWRDTNYRINEIRTTTETAFLKLYWDWTPRPDLVFRFQIENTIGKALVRKRVLYNGPRSAGLISAYERREASLDPFLMMRVRKTF